MNHIEPPQAIESEKATLGSVLLNRDAIVPVAPWLLPGMFYLERHATIYAAMLDLFHQRTPPDTRSVAQSLKQSGALDSCGGIPYLSDLIDAVPTSYHIEHYARHVERASKKRDLIAAGGKIAGMGYRDESDPEQDAAEAHSLLTHATASMRVDDLISGRQATNEAWDALHTDAPAFVSSGFPDLDNLLGGLHGGDFVIVAARPAVGKTSWALSLLRNLCMARSSVPLFFELEMNREQVVQRLISMESGVETRVLRMRAIPDERTHGRLATAFGTVGDWEWTICDFAGQTPHQIHARTMRHIAEHPNTVVIVDYIGLMAPDGKQESRNQEVSALSLALKNLARDADVPVIALCQLNRAVEGRANHRPMLSDLRDSGSLEQDADSVLFLYREELYDKSTDKKGIADLIVEKNRHGPVGVVPLRFDAQTTRFDTLSYRESGGYEHVNNA